jgi:hypothetical protein
VCAILDVNSSASSAANFSVQRHRHFHRIGGSSLQTNICIIAIGLIVSNILLALSMMMGSPMAISLPYQLMLFVLVNGCGIMIQDFVLTYREVFILIGALLGRTMNDFLLIDTSTEIVQCATVILDGKVTGIMRGSGDVVEIFPNHVGKICKSGFHNMLGIAACYEPGSTWICGPRSWLLMFGFGFAEEIKVFWLGQPFDGEPFSKKGAITGDGSGKFTAETLDGEVKILNSPDGFGKWPQSFQTGTHGMQFVNYDLEKFEANIFETTHEIETSDLFEIEKQRFSRCSSESHRANHR